GMQSVWPLTWTKPPCEPLGSSPPQPQSSVLPTSSPRSRFLFSIICVASLSAGFIQPLCQADPPEIIEFIFEARGLARRRSTGVIGVSAVSYQYSSYFMAGVGDTSGDGTVSGRPLTNLRRAVAAA